MSAWCKNNWIADGWQVGIESVLDFSDAVSDVAPGMTNQEAHLLLAIAKAGDRGLHLDLSGQAMIGVARAMRALERQDYIAMMPGDLKSGIRAAVITPRGDALLERIAERWRANGAQEGRHE